MVRDSTSTPALNRSIGVLGGAVIGASSTAATTTIAVGIGVLAALAGRQTPALLLVAFLPILGIAGAYARLNRSEPNCGNGYAWVRRSMGPWLGLLAGWIPLAGTVVFLAYTTEITGSVLVQVMRKAGLRSLFGWELDPNSTAQGTVLGVLVLAAVSWTAVIGVAKATKFQTWLLAFEYSVLLFFCGWGLVAGDHAFSLSWLDPFEVSSPSRLAQGLVLAVFFYWGWEAAFTVSEETRTPGDASRGGFIALFTMLGLALLGSIAFQRVLTGDELVANGVQGFAYLAGRLAGEPLATLPLIALMFSVVGSLQAGVIPTARFTLAMSRDRTLGPIWARVHRRYGSPAWGTVLIAVIAAGVAALTLMIPKLNEAVLACVNAIGTLVAFYYGLTSIACALRFRGLLRTNRREALRAVVVPAVCGLLLLALDGYLVVYYATLSDTFAVSASNGWFCLACPAAIIVAGLVIGAIAKWRRRSPYFDRPAETAGPDAGLPAIADRPAH